MNHVRYAVQVGDKWCGRNYGHNYTTGQPGYELVTNESAARLFSQKGAATKAAKVLDGLVVHVSVRA